MTQKLKIELKELIFALENHSWESQYYLDSKTGDIILVTDDTGCTLDKMLGETDKIDDPEWSTLFAQNNLQDWEQAEVRDAYRVKMAPSRYVPIEPDEPYDSYNDMEAFIDSVPEGDLQVQLADSIRGKGAFRRFKDTLSAYLAEEARWFSFEEARMRQRAIEFLSEHSIQLLT